MGEAAVEHRWRALELPPRCLTRRNRTAALRARRLEVREGVEEILERHPELRAFVREVAAKLREMFGERFELALERFHDPGALGEEDRLFLFVRTDLDPEAAQAMLMRFDESWWLANSHRGGHLLQVSVEFL